MSEPQEAPHAGPGGWPRGWAPAGCGPRRGPGGAWPDWGPGVLFAAGADSAASAPPAVAEGLFLLALGLLTWVSVRASDLVVRETGTEDPGYIVADEWVGMWITLWPLRWELTRLCAAGRLAPGLDPGSAIPGLPRAGYLETLARPPDPGPARRPGHRGGRSGGRALRTAPRGPPAALVAGSLGAQVQDLPGPRPQELRNGDCWDSRGWRGQKQAPSRRPGHGSGRAEAPAHASVRRGLPLSRNAHGFAARLAERA